MEVPELSRLGEPDLRDPLSTPGRAGRAGLGRLITHLKQFSTHRPCSHINVSFLSGFARLKPRLMNSRIFGLENFWSGA